ncbi:MAG: transcriptional regulator NrdR [Alphaproteobacteria bacterium]
MRCPFCAHEESDVKDSRLSDDSKTIKRRRQCKECGARFSTFERIELRELVVVKKNGESEIFQREKLARSVFLACRKRGINNEKIESIISSLVRELETSGDSEIPTSGIGEWVMKRLAGLDKVAFIRYASVYKDFDQVKDFEVFIEKEIDEKK